MKKHYRLAAIDIDGTLVNGSHTISAENRACISRMAREGMEIVLASGRHHVSMLPFAAQLPEVHWMVSSQGGEVSDISRGKMLSQIFLDTETMQRCVEVGETQNFAIVVYASDGVYRLSDEKAVRAYATLDASRIRQVSLADCRSMKIFKVIWIGDPKIIETIEQVPAVAALPVTKVRSHLDLFELLPGNINKGAGVAALAKHLGINPEEAVVFGDAENDIPMFQWAGTSVAMPGPWPKAIAAASHVAPEGPGETALARGIKLVLG